MTSKTSKLTHLLLLLAIIATASSNVNNCFSCQDQCGLVNVVDCETNDERCYTIKQQQDDDTVLTTKGCVKISESDDLCKNLNPEPSSCIFCDYDQCNTDSNPPVDNIITNTGVESCHSCEGDCDQTIIQNCTEVLADNCGEETFQAACLTFSVTEGDYFGITKHCVKKDDVINLTCLFMNTINGISCNICENDNCNPATVYKCHSCQGDCHETTVDYCDSVTNNAETVCYAIKEFEGNRPSFTKGCIAADQSTSLCESKDNCEICDSNLCNTHYDNEIHNIGVEKCYWCDDNCNGNNNDIKEQNCTELLANSGLKVFEAACLSQNISKGNGIYELTRRCIDNSEIEKARCLAINLQDGATCEICNSNLCNDLIIDDIKSVDKCYHCNGTCDKPIKEQNCKEALGDGVVARCLSSKSVSTDNVTLIIKSCVEHSDIIYKTCEVVNLSENGECSICDSDLCNGSDNDDDDDNNDDDKDNSSLGLQPVWLSLLCICLLQMLL